MSYTYKVAGKPLVKIGLAEESLSIRHDSMNREGYGAVFDWRIVYHTQVPAAGAVKAAIKTRLSSFKVPGRFYRETNLPVEASEIFAIDLAEAIKIAKSYVAKALKKGIH
jgi:hypothetical protein